MNSHMEKLSSILGDGFMLACNREMNEPFSPLLKSDSKSSKTFSNKHSFVHRASAVNPLDVNENIAEMSEEHNVEQSSTLSPQKLGKEGGISFDLAEAPPAELDQDEIDNINFMSILMYVNGEDNGVRVANDEQFEEICKLMNEYYGVNQNVLNKYEVWKKYTQTLKMK